MNELSIILHGGAWSRSPSEINPEEAVVLRRALDAGWNALCAGLPGERAVVDAIRVLEDCELFDAGYGSFPNEHGEVFTDVALMRGNGDFISLLGVSQVRYPSEVAFDMLQPGARLMTIWTDRRCKAVRDLPADVLRRYGYVEDPSALVSPFARKQSENIRARRERVRPGGHDTVGCVVRDRNGKITAGTSTGGTACKPDGRVGDAPIVGAGVFALDEVVGLSATGDGERILQSLLSGFVIAEVRRQTLHDSNCFLAEPELLSRLINDELARMRGQYPTAEAGLIVMPRHGLPCYGFNATSMCVATRTGTPERVAQEEVGVAIR